VSITVRLTREFLREAKHFFRKHPELEAAFERLVEDLQIHPFQPRLHLHPLRGQLQGLHAVSLTHSYRITLTLQISEQVITLIAIGSHDEVYRDGAR
jgi:addiction module RelE/StbE family toxin